MANEYTGKITTVDGVDLFKMHPYDRYVPSAFDGSLTMLEKINRIIYNMNKLGELSNELVSQWNGFVEWLLSEGISGAVEEKLNEWLASGVLGEEIQEIIEKLLAYRDSFGVNVVMLGADPTGVKDSTQAFKDAIGTGDSVVFVPQGTFKVSGICLKSNTKLYGIGQKSIIKLTDEAPVTANLLTNCDWSGGNSDIIVENLKLDWNMERPGGKDTITTGNVDGCNLVFVNVKNAHVTNVHAYNAGRHNFDVSASRYHHDGDSPTVWEQDGCENIYFSKCFATGSGDDGFTTHFSKHIHIDSCESVDPDGRLFDGAAWNANCFEVDDGSQHVTVSNCYAKGGARGFESKAHNHSPAPQNVRFVNCTAEENIRAFDFRHNDFNHATDGYSATAQDITVENCTAINPRNNSRYASLDCRALVVSSYKRVQITNFTAIGDLSDSVENPVAIQQLARDVDIVNMKISGFNCERGIRVAGAPNLGEDVRMRNISIYGQYVQGVQVGEGVNRVSMDGIKVENRLQTAGSTGIATAMSDIPVANTEIINFETGIKIGSLTTDGHATRTKTGGFTAATTTGGATVNTGAVLASTGQSEANGDMSFVASSSTAIASGKRTAILSSGDTVQATGDYSSVMSTRRGWAAGSRSTVLSSYGIVNPQANSVAGGHNGGTTESSSANRKWQLNSENGNITAVGTVTGGSTFSDYAEYFESYNGEAIPSGTIVTLSGDKIIECNEGEQPIGIISETAGVALGESSFQWASRYLYNEFGGLITERKTIVEMDEGTGEELQSYEMDVPVINPDYDPNQEYVNREERPEWNIVGLMGQMYVRIDETVTLLSKVVPGVEGIGTHSDIDGWTIMAIPTPYDAVKGYGVAKVLVV